MVRSLYLENIGSIYPSTSELRSVGTADSHIGECHSTSHQHRTSNTDSEVVPTPPAAAATLPRRREYMCPICGINARTKLARHTVSCRRKHQLPSGSSHFDDRTNCLQFNQQEGVVYRWSSIGGSSYTTCPHRVFSYKSGRTFEKHLQNRHGN